MILKPLFICTNPITKNIPENPNEEQQDILLKPNLSKTASFFTSTETISAQQLPESPFRSTSDLERLEMDLDQRKVAPPAPSPTKRLLRQRKPNMFDLSQDNSPFNSPLNPRKKLERKKNDSLSIEKQEIEAQKRQKMIIPGLTLTFDFDSDSLEADSESEPQPSTPESPLCGEKAGYEIKPKFDTDVLDFDIFEEEKKMALVKKKLAENYAL